MHYRRLRKRPADARLAKNVPEKGMHGYLPRLDKELRYWQQRRQSAFDLADGASYDLADSLVDDIGQVARFASIWKTIGAINKGFNRQHPHWDRWENGRRDRLGVLALSIVCRELFPPESQQHLIDYRGLPEDDREVHLLPEPSAYNDRDNVVDARVHMPAGILDEVLDPYDPEVEGSKVWYKSEGYDGLYLRREYPANPTASYMAQLIDRGVRVNFDELQTVFPYLPAR